MNIVLTNDDGVNAPGINILREVLKNVANVVVVAPLTERSTTGHTLTLDTTVRLEEIAEDIYGCSGYPADCTLMAIGHLFKNKDSKFYGKKIDLVISGINRGANLGQDIFYSGTVAAAREATFHGHPAIAVSSCLDFKSSDSEKAPYYMAAEFIKKLVVGNVHQHISPLSLLNVNIPWCSKDEIKGVRVTKQGMRKYSEDIEERLDFKGRKYYWIGGVYKGFQDYPGSDCHSVDQKYISLCPLRLHDFGPPAEVLHQKLQLFVDEMGTN